MFQPGCMAARKRIKAPGRSGNSKRNRRSLRASSLRPPTDAATSARMSRQRRTDTVPEIALRRELHRRGARFCRGLQEGKVEIKDRATGVVESVPLAGSLERVLSLARG